MENIVGFFKQRWLISLLGILALALLIWFVGPLLAIADWEPFAPWLNRLLTILVLLVLWGLNQLRKYLRARRNNQQLLEGLAGPAGDPTQRAVTAEIAELRARFDEALTILKKARLDRSRGHHYLYQLPWYIIIGPPGSGKTTALLNSGLHFPLAKRFGKGEIQGVGGTRNCDWFFTDEAVLLDTAGRYVTQDSHQTVDSAAWASFLELLKKYRRRRPINGVLVAISVQDLLQQNDLEQTEQARAIKQRLQELYQHLGIRFPIYVLFTKCDLLAGFTEFFNELGREERAQVWGMTLPLDDTESSPGVLANFAVEFDTLEQRLNARLLTRLQQERDSQNRNLLYLFPQQFSSLKSTVERFLNAVFQPSRFEERALLRGVYFTSGTQEGTPIDRIMGVLAATFSLDRQAAPRFSGIGKSYFITRLLREVLFQEAGLAGINLRLERRRAWLQGGAYAGALVLTGLLAALWCTSYFRNQSYIDEVNQQVQVLQTSLEHLSSSKRSDVLAVLPLLDTARTIPGGYQDRNKGTPLLMGFGLYQGDKLGAEAAVAAYRHLLDRVFLPRILLRLEEQLRQSSADPDYLQEALKVYLMLGDPVHFNASTVKNWISRDWEQTLSRQSSLEQRQALQDHLDALLEKLPIPLPVAQDTELIRRVREHLSQIPSAQRIYAQIKGERLGDKVPPFRISEAAGRDAPLVFIRRSGQPLSEGIPGLYTHAGYYKVFIEASQDRIRSMLAESWILGSQIHVSTKPEELQPLSEQVRNLYLRDYAQRWEELLADIDIRSPANLSEAVAITNVLSGADSPLFNLLRAADREISLEQVAPEEQQATGKVPAANQALQHPGQAADTGTTPAKSANPVEERFAALHRLVQSQGLDAARSLLNELFVYLNAIASAADQGGAVLNAAKNQAGGIISKLQLETSRQPLPLKHWLQGLAEDSSRLILGGVKEQLNAIWTAEVIPFCRQAIENRYPLVRKSSSEITLEDFGHFFGPGGLMEKYFQTNLQSFVDTTQNPWRWRGTGSTGPGISAEALAQFQRAAAIKEAFFRGGSLTPAVRFELKPITMDANASQFLLDLDSQQSTYSQGPAKPTPMQWPGPKGSNQVQIQFTPPAASGRSGLTLDGPWAWFKLLDQSEISRTHDPARLIVTFKVEERWARYELSASSAFNPFGFKELEQFQCPQRL
jgi:type VI secretion system protein ImpL